ncbi:MAG TPA: signal recognition particle protein [Candidatus Poseidoniales archaeon]|jgi:signal recognition particle subunit SRP54|nr:MAG: signal recognition particle protein [Euryarchaeota archaeon]HIG03919.1 signal recognition particle protein [Candidatus Poseidoniales archaeon]HIK77830.1 signal recognition particle protein [Candidatus Poseidoniales archaeon]
MALDGLRSGIFSALSKIKGRTKLDEGELADMIKSLRRALQEADFNVRQTKELTDRVEDRLRNDDRRPGITFQTQAMNILYSELVRMLGESREVRPHAQTILMVGLYGQGKTTTTAKLAEWYRRRHGVKVAVIEADVHRPGAYHQLKQLLEDTNIVVYGEPDEKDAPTIVRNGLAAVGSADIVIVDTAGRHQLDQDLVKELEYISKLCQATERFLVIDAQVGQAAGPVAASFHDLVSVTGVIVTKLDGTARGGGALSAVATTGAPIMYLGIGEKVADLEKFESNGFISRLLGMGDIKGLIDLAPEDLDEAEAMRITERMMTGRFTLNDMYKQMEMMSKVGTVDKLLSFLPTNMFGMGGMTKGQQEDMQGNLDKFRIIMDSMTNFEKDNPKSMKAERIRRIARGAGVNEKEVRELISQWGRSKKMMKGMTSNRKMSRQMKQMMKGNDMDMDDFGMGA